MSKKRWTIGIDPGFTGALAAIYRSPGGIADIRVEPMPIKQRTKNGERTVDLEGLDSILRDWTSSLPGYQQPSCRVGLEWPTTRPGEGAERSARFGRQLGILEATLWHLMFNTVFLPPAKWKGHLGLPGKSDPEADAKGEAFLIHHYTADRIQPLTRGPRGGIQSGKVDALCIAHYTAAAVSTIDNAALAKTDDEKLAALANAGPRRRPLLRGPQGA